MIAPPGPERAAQRGMTLIEGMLAGILLAVMLVAVTGVAMSFTSSTDQTGSLVADQEAARDAIGRITMELRSAGPGELGPVLLRTSPTDLAFASDRLAEASPGQWRAARYCWDGADVVRQISTALAPPAAVCPDPTWSAPRPVARTVSGPLFSYSTAAGSTPSVTVTFDVGAARPLESAVTVRNRGLGSGAVSCTTTTDNNALVTVDIGVAQPVVIPVRLHDLPGLRALMFGSEPPPATWSCP
jgi:type II secretory pathway pseudopilin PulG